MHVISRKKLRAFSKVHADAESALDSWYKTVKKAEWGSFAEVQAVFRSADQVKKFTIFNIGGNKYRLVAVIHFNRGKVFIRDVLTHREYDQGKWKRD